MLRTATSKFFDQWKPKHALEQPLNSDGSSNDSMISKLHPTLMEENENILKEFFVVDPITQAFNKKRESARSLLLSGVEHDSFADRMYNRPISAAELAKKCRHNRNCSLPFLQNSRPNHLSTINNPSLQRETTQKNLKTLSLFERSKKTSFISFDQGVPAKSNLVTKQSELVKKSSGLADVTEESEDDKEKQRGLELMFIDKEDLKMPIDKRNEVWTKKNKNFVVISSGSMTKMKKTGVDRQETQKNMKTSQRASNHRAPLFSWKPTQVPKEANKQNTMEKHENMASRCTSPKMSIAERVESQNSGSFNAISGKAGSSHANNFMEGKLSRLLSKPSLSSMGSPSQKGGKLDEKRGQSSKTLNQEKFSFNLQGKSSHHKKYRLVLNHKSTFIDLFNMNL